MQTQFENTDSLTPSYVNIGSSILRNKFEKNRVLTVKKNADNVIELSNEDKINILNNKFIEYDVKFDNFKKESKNVENKVTSVTSSVSEIQSKFDNVYVKSEFEDRIQSVTSSIGEIQSKFDNVYVKSEFEDRIQSIMSSINEIQLDLDNVKKGKKIDLFETIDLTSSTILKLLIDTILPKNFDFEIYRDLNGDLQSYDEIGLKKHYLIYGKHENRNYKVLNKNVPDDFDWKEYLRMNIDLLKNFHDEYNTSLHYINYGIHEHRMYKMSQLEDVNFFIYCGRKSGSTTLNHTCSNIENGLSIQIHNNEDYLYKYGQCKFNSIFELVENNMNKHETIYIIDSYRPPIEKKISSFFEDIDKLVPNYKDCDISFLISYFNKKYIYGNKCTHICTEDYEPLDEMLEHFNLSPIKKFNFDQEYELLKYKNLIFIKLRFREIDNWDVLLSKIIGKDVTVIDKNRSENKDYYEVYENFKKTYRIPREYLEKLKSDSRFKIYNSSLERIKYIKEWFLKSV